ncbi:hypothetical protein MHSWG343_04840 [Candidatus Mycoplasma haematohominis]|uniref:Uncharacterized protein n=1 Tax=Candidatus Mycoplasma haematohominis TaxID=1494318 RepID=A0A478FQT7_9MOLU|nr:hypothetical protein MHSWG343_04840 [Candidatus Mycoplasma haemohominis]
MSLAAKGGIALVVVASSVTGGYFLFNPGTKETKHVSVLSSLSNLNLAYESGKFGNDYSKYMVDPNNPDNEWWWNKVYANFVEDTTNSEKNSKLSTEFKNVSTIDKAYAKSTDNNSNKALNQVCDAAFKDEESKWTSKNYYVENVWTYCSIFNKKYIFVNSSSYTNKLGGDAQHKNKALSTNNSDNQSLWDLRNKEFIGEGNKTGTGAISSEGSVFSELYAKRSTTLSDDSIKQTCQKAYDILTNAGTTSPKATHEDIKKFCYLMPE